MYNAPQVVGEIIIIRQNNVILVMLAETIMLLKKTSKCLVLSDNDIEELTKNFANLKITKRLRSPFVFWSEEDLKKIQE